MKKHSMCKMIRKAYKFELMPNGEMIRKMKSHCGCRRFVYNRALAYNNEQYAKNKNFRFSTYRFMNMLPEWKKEFFWLKECNAQSLQQTIADLEKAFKRFFNGISDFPVFKKKGRDESYRIPQNFKIDQEKRKIYLPKIGWVRYCNKQRVEGKIKNITISTKCGKWFASIQVEQEIEIPLPKGGEIGIDRGIARFATLSDGTFFEPINAYKQNEEKLKNLQKKLARQEKGSKNREKTKLKIQKLHYRIANVRKNHLHQISSKICKNHAIIFIEDLKVTNMSKSAKGTLENPGKKVKQKSGLNKAILDQGWGEFARQLDYKSHWNGGCLIKVPPHFTSQTCPACFHCAAENRKTRADFVCVECGYSENADVVAAINILKKGREFLMVESPKSSGMDQPGAPCQVSDAVMSPATGTQRSDEQNIGSRSRKSLESIFKRGDHEKALQGTL